MEAVGSPTGRGGIPPGGIEGIGREREKMGSLWLFRSPSLSRPDLFIPRFLAPHALGVSIVSPCLAETRRETRSRSRTDRLSEEAVVTITRSLFSFRLSPSLPRGTPGFVVGSARDNVAGTRIHWARPVRAETNDYRKLPLCVSISLFPFLSLSLYSTLVGE